MQDGCLVNARANRIFLLFQRAFWTFTFALANLLSGAVNLYFYRYEISRLDYQPLLEKEPALIPLFIADQKQDPGDGENRAWEYSSARESLLDVELTCRFFRDVA